VFLVTLAEATPVHEAEHLAEDLKRAGIVPFAWIVNQTWAGYRVSHPVLAARQSNEQEFIQRVRDLSGDRVATIHWQINEPNGVENLSRLTDPRWKQLLPY
jgi:arsenite-transporting ATPase